MAANDPRKKTRLSRPVAGMPNFIQQLMAWNTKQGPPHWVERIMDIQAPIDSPARVVDLPCSLNDASNTPEKIVIRQVFKTIMVKIDSAIDSNQLVLLGGGNATGKSTFATLFAVHRAYLGELVVYRRISHDLLVIAPNMNETCRNVLEEQILRNRHDYDMESFTPGVHVLGQGDDGLLKCLLSSLNVTVIHDVGEDPDQHIFPDFGRSKTVIVSSPNPTMLDLLTHKINIVRIFMPLWTLPELQLARQCFPNPVDAATVEARFNAMGGTPRYVLELPVGVSERMQHKALNSVSLKMTKMLEQAFTSSSFKELPEMSGSWAGAGGLDLLLKIVPTEDLLDFTCTFLSSEISRKLAMRYAEAENDKALAFVRATLNQPLLATCRDQFVKTHAHTLLRTLITFETLRDLPAADSGGGTPRPLMLHYMREIVFKTLDDITTLAPFQYCCPESKNFQYSFVVERASLFNPSATPDQWALVGFHLAISPGTGPDTRYPVSGSAVKRLQERVHDIVQLPDHSPNTSSKVQLPFYLVFITQTDVLLQEQDIVEDDGRLVTKQFSLTLGKGFDKVIELSSTWQ